MNLSERYFPIPIQTGIITTLTLIQIQITQRLHEAILLLRAAVAHHLQEVVAVAADQAGLRDN